MKELENDLEPNILKYHQLDIADQNSISVFSKFIQSEHQGRDLNEQKIARTIALCSVIFKYRF